MRILIDADACPVLDIIAEIAREYGLELLIFVDICHQLAVDYGQIIQVDKREQGVDMALFNQCQAGDLVLTQDYGLAAMVLGKKAQALNFFGMVFTNKNIDTLLLKRHINAKIRRGGGRHPTHSKRTENNDQKFKKVLLRLIKERINR